MGRISFAIAEAAPGGRRARHRGAGDPNRSRRGVELESGELIRARAVISNADPKRVLGMLDPEALPENYRERLEGGRCARRW